ncbi:transient receptor potential cation channel subfamily V member 6-like [Eriocheir sinensis]|uniref:transient receptor potential cation channel subfamily V member 6-like n=1 Tax=Eriocheir sinensis TaxID=95602 RepID=UPI0021C62E9C|nr:transient receptor potential cation channel subfamily V member 6-like [Eriocheir sinensis]
MGACATKKEAINPGSALDRVISQASSDDCVLYRLADYKKGGRLIEEYSRGGGKEVERLILEEFGVFMYNHGRGKEITRTEYLKWKYRKVPKDQMVVHIHSDKKSPFDPLHKWNDHEACWQMQFRGSLGETLLHVLIMCDTKAHTRVAKILLRCFPRLCVDVVEGEEYLGASALHLAIAYGNNELVTILLTCGAYVQQRAIGSFFLPRDQQVTVPPGPANTDYEGLAYLGEYPLAWAACLGNETVYNKLLDYDADPNAQDNFGNMILHMVVVCNQLGMFSYALRHPRNPAQDGIMNETGLTPLTLACRLARSTIFKEMLELTCIEFWRYSNITCSAYPLNALDTIRPSGETNWNSALMIILNGTKSEHLDMLEGGIIQRLLEEKWKTFARNQFLKRLAIMLLQLILMSGAVYLRPCYCGPKDMDKHDEVVRAKLHNDFFDYDVQSIARYCFEAGTLAGVISYVVFQQGEEIMNQGLSSFMRGLVSE